ncbi:hypothetical protein B0H19DRAFT_1085869 [Mycena capillaripes]|nr:hypothetical protein B0H19DRAFT_1085869 [Mycena capillaripes]
MNPMSYNNQHYANARLLLGMGPMPPPTNQDLAVAQMQQSLNQGMYRVNYHIPVGGPYGGNMPHYHGTHLAPWMYVSKCVGCHGRSEVDSICRRVELATKNGQ